MLILGKILVEGLPAISWSFFTELPPSDPYSSGGISSALVGTLILMGLATLFSAPLGILVALFINDAAANGGRVMRRVGAGVGFIVDVLLGLPSIVAGLIVYLGVVIAMGHFSALAGGIALGILMFPIVVRSSDEILQLVPTAQKEAALALGAPALADGLERRAAGGRARDPHRRHARAGAGRRARPRRCCSPPSATSSSRRTSSSRSPRCRS